MSTQLDLGKRIGTLALLLLGGLLLGAPAHAQNVAPVISGTPSTTAVPGRIYSFQPSATDANGDRLTFSAAGVPGWAKFDRRTGRLSGAPSSRHLGKSYAILISVTDGQLAASLPRFTVTVATTSPPPTSITPDPTPSLTPPPNSPPTIGGTPATTVVEGELYGFVPTASDPDGNALTFSIANKPGWATFTASSGLLSGTPPAGSANTYSNVTISVSDGTSSVSLAPFSITVTAKPNSPPSISGVPATSVTSGQAYSFKPSASDPDGQPLTFSISGRPSWASFDPVKGTLSGTPSASHAGTYPSIVITASDGQLSTSLPAFTITVVASNTPPTIGGTPATSVVEGELYGFLPTASDPDGNALTFSIGNRPAWATFTASTGLLSGIPPAGSAGTFANVTISVSDGTATASLAPFSITVKPKPNSPPSIWGIPATSVTSGQAYTFKPSASDPEGQKLTFAVQGMPGWASFDTGTGTLSGTPSWSHAGTYPGITISVSDGQASASLAPFTVTVTASNTPPRISGTPADSVTAGQSYSFVPTASDPEGQTLTFSIAGKPTWASFDATTGRLSGVPGAAQAGVYSGIVITASDGQLSTSLPAFSVAVASPPTAGSATLSWSPPTSNVDGTPLTDLAGYRVVYGQAAGVLDKSLTIAGAAITSASIENLAPGTWYFAVKAYTSANVESDLSNVAQKTIN
jgi:hypothetical protein